VLLTRRMPFLRSSRKYCCPSRMVTGKRAYATLPLLAMVMVTRTCVQDPNSNWLSNCSLNSSRLGMHAVDANCFRDKCASYLDFHSTIHIHRPINTKNWIHSNIVALQKNPTSHVLTFEMPSLVSLKRAIAVSNSIFVSLTLTLSKQSSRCFCLCCKLFSLSFFLIYI
jgi:hypothetical protein